MSKPKVVSLYSGAGGLDIGFHKAGFDIIFANDNWKPAYDTLLANGFVTEVSNKDVGEINFKAIKKKKGPVACLIGGPPCPPYSKSRFYLKNKKRGIEDTEGEHTLENFVRALKELDPEVFLFENVHGFVYKPHKSALKFLENESNKQGYVLNYQVINAADYGVPQKRQRFICVGSKKQRGVFKFPKPTHIDPSATTKDKEMPNWITCKDAIGDLDVKLPGDKEMEAGSKHKDLLKKIPPGQNYLFFTKKRGHPNPKFEWRSRYWSFLLKLSPDLPSWTIQASHSNNQGPFHWRNRFLRISEIKRIQTFPDEYTLIGDYKTKWRLVGNAVPPLLSKKLAKAIMTQFFNQKKEKV